MGEILGYVVHWFRNTYQAAVYTFGINDEDLAVAFPPTEINCISFDWLRRQLQSEGETCKLYARDNLVEIYMIINKQYNTEEVMMSFNEALHMIRQVTPENNWQGIDQRDEAWKN